MFSLFILFFSPGAAIGLTRWFARSKYEKRRLKLGESMVIVGAAAVVLAIILRPYRFDLKTQGPAWLGAAVLPIVVVGVYVPRRLDLVLMWAWCLAIAAFLVDRLR